jgi:hypothetical protein
VAGAGAAAGGGIVKNLQGARRFVLNAERLLALLRRHGYIQLTGEAEVVQVATDGLFSVELVVNKAVPDDALWPEYMVPTSVNVKLPSHIDRLAEDQERTRQQTSEVCL